MKYSELNINYNKIIRHLAAQELKDAFNLLGKLIAQCTNIDYKTQLENHIETYKNILKYSFELGDDPQREDVYNRLQKSVIELADDVKEDLVSQHKLLSYSHKKNEIRKKQSLLSGESKEYIDSLGFAKEVEEILHTKSNKISKEKSEKMANIFSLLWLTDRLKESEIELVKKINQSKDIEWYDKSLIVSALILSLIRQFDINKVFLLFDFYDSFEHKVWQRALIGVVIGLYYYDDRLFLYPEIVNRLKSLQGNKQLEKYIEDITIQFLKTKETEKISKKIKEDILPEIIKMQSQLEEKLNLDDISSIQDLEDKNPEWQVFFEDSPGLTNKFEEFSNLQMDGSDVFMSAFAMLKNLPFFNEISNWFTPFYKENPDIDKELGIITDEFDSDSFCKGIEGSSFLCNSDKYSFCFNIKNMPISQRTMMLSLFNMEVEAMNELDESDNLIDQNKKNRVVFTHFIQDIYRFFKLFPQRNDFEDIFNLPFTIHEAGFFKLLVSDATITRNIGEYYFGKERYKESCKVFEILAKENRDFELFEKIAFCYQKTGDFKSALEYYLKAELLEKNSNWIMKKIAFCYRKTKQYSKALEYYLKLEKSNPDDYYIQSSLGHTYMEMNDYTKALEYYFKVEYLSSENYKIRRPIAWCSFILGKFDVAEKYFKKIIEKESTENDYLNLGHVLWCLNDKKKAIESYKLGIEKSGKAYKWFKKAFTEDSKYLIQHGISEFDIKLMKDYLK